MYRIIQCKTVNCKSKNGQYFVCGFENKGISFIYEHDLIQKCNWITVTESSLINWNLQKEIQLWKEIFEYMQLTNGKENNVTSNH